MGFLFTTILIFPLTGDAKILRVNGLGTTVGKPALTYLRVRNEIIAAVITGCGADPDAVRGLRQNSEAPGRCALILRADNGEVIRALTPGPDVGGDTQMTYPLMGGVAVYPNSGTVPSDRAYVGDTAGQLWRMDLRSSDPNNWKIAVAWPPQDAVERQGYRLGRSIQSTPSLALRRDGRLAVVFGTGDEGTAVEDTASTVVSFSDDLKLSEAGSLEFDVTSNWVMPLRQGEVFRGDSVIYERSAFFTSLTEATNADEQCAAAVPRVYAVDYIQKTARYDTNDGRTLDVLPRLPPIKTEGGGIVTDGIALILPSGLSVDGLSIVRSPSCASEQAPTTEMIFNYASAQRGVQTSDLLIERKEGDAVDESVDETLVRRGGQDVSISVTGNGALDQPVQGGDRGMAPFPRQVLYWGTSLGE